MTAARGDKVRFLSSHAHAAHPTRPVDKGISAMRPDCELAVESIHLPTRSSAFEWEIKLCTDSASPWRLSGKNARNAKRTRCIPPDLRHTIETALGCQLRKLARGSSTYVR